MFNSDELKRDFEFVEQKLEELVKSERLDLRAIVKFSIPDGFGVYLFADKNDGDKVLYVGSSITLQKRIYHQHLGRGKRSSSALQKTLLSQEKEGLNLKKPAEVADYIKNNWYFSFVTINDEDRRARSRKAEFISVIETLAILMLKPFYNKHGKTR